jgi:hypothetical protein
MLRASPKFTLIFVSLVFSDVYNLTRRPQYIPYPVTSQTHVLSHTQTSQIPHKKMVEAQWINCTFKHKTSSKMSGACAIHITQCIFIITFSVNVKKTSMFISSVSYLSGIYKVCEWHTHKRWVMGWGGGGGGHNPAGAVLRPTGAPRRPRGLSL